MVGIVSIFSTRGAPPWRAVAALLAAVLSPACATGPHAAFAPEPAAVALWVSTADQRQALAPDHADVLAGDDPKATVIKIDPATQYQEMTGFGASITDASAWLIRHRMNAAQREALLHELFAREDGGLGLSLARLTIGASDFSLRHYSLDDVAPGASDAALAHFSIAPMREDVLPVVRAALAINARLRVMASPWSAPGWMKTTDSLIGGTLRDDAIAAFAEYLVRYVEASAAEGVPIFALTVQNEPGFEPPDYPGMLLLAAARARLIGEFLGPLLAQRAPQTQILDWDHNWNRPYEPLGVLGDAVARRYVAGVAWHCYEGHVQAQVPVHDAYPDKEAYLTECSGGDWWRADDALVTMTRDVVIGSIRGWAKGVLLWNLALDEQHGPHSGGCRDCRGVVTIDHSGRFQHTVDYTVLAHASRFVRPGARRIESSTAANGVDNVAFRNADGSLVLLAVNSAPAARRIAVHAGAQAFAYTMPARSVATFVRQDLDSSTQ